MKKGLGIMAAAAVLTLAVSFPAMAGEWRQDMDGSYWYRNDDGSYPAGGWHWLDGNGDGIAESYYFNENGYLVQGPGKADGYDVDENGAWIVDGNVQTRNVNEGQDSGQESGRTADFGDPMDPAYAHKRARELYLGLNDYDMKIQMQGEFIGYGFSMPISLESQAKAHGVQEGDLRILETAKGYFLGIDMEATDFYVDGYGYYSSEFSQYREPMDRTEAIEGTIANYFYLSEEDLDLVSEMSIRQEGENRILNMTFDPAKMGLEEEDGISYRVNEAGQELVLNPDGYCVRQVIRFNVDMIQYLEGGITQTSGVKVTITSSMENPGQLVEVPIPSTAGYEEIYSLE